MEVPPNSELDVVPVVVSSHLLLVLTVVPHLRVLLEVRLERVVQLPLLLQEIARIRRILEALCQTAFRPFPVQQRLVLHLEIA